MIERITGAALVAGFLLLTCGQVYMTGIKPVMTTHHGTGHMEEK